MGKRWRYCAGWRRKVLDPFAGSGTVLEVAKALGCEGVGIELNPEYCKLAEKRLAQEVLGLFAGGLSETALE